MSKTNPVVLNGASIAGATGVELKDGDEVVFPSAESERIVFKYQLVAAATGAFALRLAAEKERAVEAARQAAEEKAAREAAKREAEEAARAGEDEGGAGRRLRMTTSQGWAKRCPDSSRLFIKRPARDRTRAHFFSQIASCV